MTRSFARIVAFCAGLALPAAAWSAVLWDQPSSTVNTSAYVNQDFEAGFEAYDTVLADNFTNADPWLVNLIYVPGDLWNGGTSLSVATALHFVIYADNAGVPAGHPWDMITTPQWALSVAPTDAQMTLSNGNLGYPSVMTLTLTTPFVLPAGTWWLVAYPEMPFSGGGQYGRCVADTTNAPTAKLINPGGGFGLGAVWTDMTPLGMSETDLAFRLEGDLADVTPDAFTFVDQFDVALSTVVESNAITVTGINGPAAISVTGGEYRIGAGAYTSTAGTVVNNDVVTVRQTSSASNSTTTDTVLTIGGIADTFSVTTVAPDTTPEQFTFVDQTGVARNTLIESAAITVAGIAAAANISVSGGEYQIDGGAWTATAGTVTNGQAVKVRLRSSNDYVTLREATLTIGGVFDAFSAITLAPGADVLVHQPTTGAVEYIAVQDFETANDMFDIYAADNFTSGAAWWITALFAPGHLNVAGETLASATSLNWAIYADASGAPASYPGSGTAPVWTHSVAPTDASVLITDGQFSLASDVTVTLAAPVRLAPGSYWLVFWPTLDYTPHGQFYQFMSSTTTTPDAQFINPAGGFGLGTVWTPIATALGYTSTDLAFRIDGFVEDVTPEPFTFTDVTGAALSTSFTSNLITVTGVNAPAAISVTGGEYQIGSGGWTSTAGTVNNNDQVAVRQTSSASFSTTTNTVLAIGSVSDTFSVTTLAADTTPDAFAFTDQTGVALSTVVTSNTITVAGINTAAAITITGGEYQIGSGAWVTTAGTVTNGQTVTVRQTSSASPATTTDTVLTIGGVSDTFSVTTVAADTTPDAFAFTDQTGVARSTVTTSNTITVAGINTGAAITITGGEYQIGSGAWVATAGTVNNAETVKVRQTSSASYATTTNTVLTIGGVSDTFSVTTVAEPQSDGGTTQQDGGTTQQDGGTTQQDGGTTQQDGGTTQQDGGTTQQDGGTTQQDGGTTQQDGGTVKQDGGSVPQTGGGGCGCSTAADADGSSALVLMLLGFGLVVLRRRRS